MQKKKLLNILGAGLIGLGGVVASCNSPHQLMDKPISACSKPLFIDGIALAGNQKSNRVNYAINAEKPAAEKPKYASGTLDILKSRYADVLGVMPNLLTNNILYNFIDEWYGTRYRLGGSDKKGVDCSAFVQKLYEQVFNTTMLRTAVEQFKRCNVTPDKEELKEGDLVFFRSGKKSRVSHVGIYLVNNFFVHSSTSSGVMISNLNEAYWKKKFAGGGKVSKEDGEVSASQTKSK